MTAFFVGYRLKVRAYLAFKSFFFNCVSRDKTNHTPPPPPAHKKPDQFSHSRVELPRPLAYTNPNSSSIYGVYTYVYTSKGRYSTKVHCGEALDPTWIDFRVYRMPRLKAAHARVRRPDAGYGRPDAGVARPRVSVYPFR